MHRCTAFISLIPCCKLLSISEKVYQGFVRHYIFKITTLSCGFRKSSECHCLLTVDLACAPTLHCCYYLLFRSSTYHSSHMSVFVPYTLGEWKGTVGSEVVRLGYQNNKTVTLQLCFITASNNFFIKSANWQGACMQLSRILMEHTLLGKLRAARHLTHLYVKVCWKLQVYWLAFRFQKMLQYLWKFKLLRILLYSVF